MLELLKQSFNAQPQAPAIHNSQVRLEAGAWAGR